MRLASQMLWYELISLNEEWLYRKTPVMTEPFLNRN